MTGVQTCALPISKDACKVEHDLSEETYSKMIAFAEKAEQAKQPL